MQDFRKLQVWAKLRQLTVEIYRVTDQFPKAEVYGLTSQMRRCASSIPANIAEGCGRDSQLDLARFLHIAMGSACEMENHLLVAHDLGLTSQEQHNHLLAGVTEVKCMLTALMGKVKPKIVKPENHKLKTEN